VMRVLVTGGSGTLGAAVLPRLLANRWSVRATSRRPRPSGDVEWVVADLATGAGVDAAVTGMAAVVHLASAATGGRAADRVDVAGTRRLATAAGRAGVRHLLYISIIGVDRVPIGYYRRKLAAEEIVAGGAAPWTILRASQFPQLLDTILRAASRLGPVIGDPAVLAQPVDPRDLADRIAGRLTDGPVERTEEYAGPRVLRFDEAARSWLAARHSRRPLLPVRIPGRTGRELRAGALTTQQPETGRLGWADYLADTYGGQPVK
jgi:uncharacterized protein YbjT (DUF2867 family)